ncbi:MAG: 4-hydroxy-tetrahydrodipicolinate reductase [Oscillospiraceae bacterium]|jgi:4-hydroxy-tetrahydrodipicolinate reductase
MPKIIISGCNGRMGQVVSRMCKERDDMVVVAGFDVKTAKLYDYPVYSDPMEFAVQADVLIDFSSPSALDRLLSYCTKKKVPAVICTTGYNEEQLQKIREASKVIPIFKSANMSLGVNLLANLLKKAASILGDNFDVEIVERHHKNKVDAPSGTAIMLADAIASALPRPSEYVYERQSVRRSRGINEIGISAVRGGTIVGEHDVIFAGPDEVIEFSHKAYSREVFANGAITAAKFLAGVTEPGMYDMNDALAEILNR